MWMDSWVLNQNWQHWPICEYAAAAHERVLFRFFESQTSCIVLASSNKAESEVNLEEANGLQTPILKRRGGGGTVVLGPGCLILTFAFHAQDHFNNAAYFYKINELWIDALESCGIHGIIQSGISDLSMHDKKIAGTSLFRSRHLLVYQGSLLVDPNFTEIFKFLKHPTKEPEYRNKRTHEDFLTSLKKEGYSLSASELAERCKSYFNAHVANRLRKHFQKI